MALNVAVIGGGSWGTAAARLICRNVAGNSAFSPRVKMWVYEETIAGEPLTRIINTRHENVKYLLGVALPEDLVASPDLGDVAADADVFVFVVPHEFVRKTCEDLEKMPRKPSAVGVSLVKGALFEGGKIVLVSALISQTLGMSMAVLMGANIASDVAKDLLAEGTLGYEREEDLHVLVPMFNCDSYRVSLTTSVGAVEMCAVLKNIVALGCGFCDGLQMGVNARAAVMRNGMLEIVAFCAAFVGTPALSGGIDKVFFESSGIADLVVTCSSGRNYRFSRLAAETSRTLAQVEKSEMNGQRLQGYTAAQEVHAFLESCGRLDEFPLLRAICEAASGQGAAESIRAAISPGHRDLYERYGASSPMPERYE